MVAEGMWVQVCLMRERRLEGGGCVFDKKSKNNQFTL